jgi:hypothetical protein
MTKKKEKGDGSLTLNRDKTVSEIHLSTLKHEEFKRQDQGRKQKGSKTNRKDTKSTS